MSIKFSEARANAKAAEEAKANTKMAIPRATVTPDKTSSGSFRARNSATPDKTSSGSFRVGNPPPVTTTMNGSLQQGGSFRAGNPPPVTTTMNGSLQQGGSFRGGNPPPVTTTINGSLQTGGSFRAGNPPPVKTNMNGSLEKGGNSTSSLRSVGMPSAEKRSTSGTNVPVKTNNGSITARDTSPMSRVMRQEPSTPRQEDIEKVVAWQTDVDSLEQQQMELQNNQMNLLHNQIHILTRELGDLQNRFVRMQQDMTAAQEEAHSALRLELAEHGNNAVEMKAAWEEAHRALKDGMDESLSNLAEKHAQALSTHKEEQAAAMRELGGGSSNSLSDIEALHNQKYEEHSACLEKGLEGVHSKLQEELAELRSGHVVNLQAVVTDVTDQVDKLTKDVEQMAGDLKAAQEEAHSALRLELAEHGNNAAEMKAAWEEAHHALSQAMDDNLSNLAEQHAQALADHKADQAQALAEHSDNLSNQGSNLSELENVHNKRYEEHTACLEKGLEDVHFTLQKELAELRSGHAVNLQAVVADVTDQVDKLTKDVEEMANDLKAAQEEAHSALRLELAEHGNNAAEMKAAWEEAHKSLSAAMDDNLASMADQHAKALEDHKTDQAQALAEHADNHGSNLADVEAVHNKRYEEHTACLEKGLEDVHSKLQEELAELRSGHAVNLQAVVTDLTGQVDKLTLDVEEMARDIKAAQEEAHSALRLELAEHGNSAAEMKAAWEEAHKALSESMDDNLASLAADHAKALEDHKGEHARALEDHGSNLNDIKAQLRGEIDGHANNLKEMQAAYDAKHADAVESTAKMEHGLQSVLESTHASLQNELADLRSGHAVSIKKVLEDLTQQTDNITLSLEQEAELRKIMEIKLDKMFDGMRGLMSISFLGNGVEDQPSNVKETPCSSSPIQTSKPPEVAEALRSNSPIRTSRPHVIRTSQLK